nr:MAG TPA: hypothetical protein [Caudoviricetes sp.]
MLHFGLIALRPFGLAVERSSVRGFAADFPILSFF